MKIFYVTFVSYPYVGNKLNLNALRINSGYLQMDENSVITPENIENWVKDHGLFTSIDLTARIKPNENACNKVIAWSEVINYNKEKNNNEM